MTLERDATKHKDKSALLIGVMALQGCVDAHRKHIEALGATFKHVIYPEDFDSVDGLILPGGESTTMLKLLDIYSLESKLLATARRVPVWGICAGAILMANEVNSPKQRSFGLLPITVERNGYGRQVDSFCEEINGYPVSFIRAPLISKTGPDVQVIASLNDTHSTQNPVWVESGQYMATTFHPELNSDTPSPMHRKFLELVQRRR